MTTPCAFPVSFNCSTRCANVDSSGAVATNKKFRKNPVSSLSFTKSVLIKATEIFQTLISTSDDILILDPQNEFKEIVEKYGGSYFDLTPKSKIYINGFEVSEISLLP